MIVRIRKGPTEPGLQAGPSLERVKMAGGGAGGFHPSAPACHLPFMASRVLVVFLPMAFLVAACAPARGGTRPIGTPEPQPVAGERGGATWLVRRGGGLVTHTIRVDAVLESRIGAVHREDLVASETVVAWRPPGTGLPARVLGTLQEHRVRSGAGAAEAPIGFALPIHFIAARNSSDGQPAFVSPDAGACDTGAGSALQGARELWLSAPDTLRAGTTWRDSTGFVVCRDGVPLHVEMIREFTAVGASRSGDRELIVIERRSLSRASGEGLQFGEAIRITGTGRGSATLLLALDGGHLVSLDGESEITLHLDSRRRTQDVTQRSRTVIRER